MPESNEEFVVKFKNTVKKQVTLDESIPYIQEGLEHTHFYVIVLYTTTEPVDSKENYSKYLIETRSELDSYFSRFDDIKKYAENQLTAGELTGFYLHGFKVRPLESTGTISMNKMHKFQVKPKTFLNGPLKDNEFIAKKGKHYA